MENDDIFKVSIPRIENAESYNCKQVAIATLANYYGREYYMIASGNLKIKYERQGDCSGIGGLLDIEERINIVDRTIKFHGFGWNFSLFNSKKINECNGSFLEMQFPFIGNIDLYHLEWSKLYHKKHSLHSIIICTYNTKTESYICLDPYFQYTYYNVSKESLFLGLIECTVLELFPKPCCCDEERAVVSAVRYDMELLNINNENDKSIRRLGNDIFFDLDLNTEFEKELYSAPILVNLRKIAVCRSAYICMLRYVAQKYKIHYLLNASNLFEQSVELWKIIQNKILKLYFQNNITINDRKSIQSMINRIANTEKSVIDIILQD